MRWKHVVSNDPARLPAQHNPACLMPVDTKGSAIAAALDRFSLPLSVLLLLGITIASLLPRGSAGDPGHADKVMHILAYAVLVAPMALAPSRASLTFAVLVLIWSGGIETLQPLVGRTASFDDFAANAAGVILGLVTGHAARRFLFRHRV